MPEIPKYLTDREDMTVDQVARHMRGEQIENPEWRRQRNDALRTFGLEPDEAPAAEKPIDDLTVDEHFNRIRRK